MEEELEKEINGNGNGKAAQRVRWKNRRRMAWVSLLAMVLVTGLILFTNLVSIEKLKVLSDVITWYYFSSASVIGAYMGFTTWASKK
jgi:hypothetical protein